MTKLKIPITAAEAHKIAKELGLCISDDGRTFFASYHDHSALFEFDSRKERDEFVKGGKL